MKIARVPDKVVSHDHVKLTATFEVALYVGDLEESWKFWENIQATDDDGNRSPEFPTITNEQEFIDALVEWCNLLSQTDNKSPHEAITLWINEGEGFEDGEYEIKWVSK